MKIMNTRMLIAMLAVFALVLAACGGDDAASTTVAPVDTTVATPDTTVSTPDTTEMMEEFVAGPLGAVTVAPGEDIQIRSLEAISGDAATLGIPNQRGTELAIQDFGPIAGRNVSIGTPLDDLCSSDGGQSAAQTIVSDERVVGVIGTSCSGAAAGAMPLISEAGMVMISPSNTSPSLTSDLAGNANENYFPGYYRTAHNDLFQGAAVAEFAYNELGVTVAAAIHDGDPYTNGLARAFADAFEALGGTVSVFTAVNTGDTDMVPVLTEVAAGTPEMIFFPIFVPEGNFIAQQVGSVSGLEDVILVAADGMLVDNFLEIPESEGVYMSGPDLRYGANQSAIGTTSEAFLAAYQEAYGEAPSASFWAHSYDATVMLLTAISNVAVEGSDGTLYIDRQALRDELTSTTGFAGIIGTINCDAFGDCGAQRITVVLHEDSSDIEAGKSNVVFEYAP